MQTASDKCVLAYVKSSVPDLVNASAAMVFSSRAQSSTPRFATKTPWEVSVSSNSDDVPLSRVSRSYSAVRTHKYLKRHQLNIRPYCTVFRRTAGRLAGIQNNYKTSSRSCTYPGECCLRNGGPG
ncbi:hypothetical protein EVAR_93441_1 [Eumeta japonica]|uniref:Uncharacterized protein n=1 Tax=Eumeta variegata TaxID=151549 RepID=A0A4C1TJ70_EUMVA|nr:hypothetical protein EVAR_93441_1 [Eumeta japonica]